MKVLLSYACTYMYLPTCDYNKLLLVTFTVLFHFKFKVDEGKVFIVQP